MKIAFVINDITRSGGTERITATLANSFCRKGHDITIISNLKENEKTYFPLNPKIDIHYIHKTSVTGNKFARLYQYVKTIFDLKKYLKKHNFDNIIGQSFPINFILYFANAHANHIACEHTYYSYYSKAIRGLRIFLYKKADIVIVLNSEDKRHFEKYLSNVRLIPNMNYFELPNQQAKLENKIIISAGRLEHHKGFDQLIKAMPVIKQKHPDWQLHIYGEGPFRSKLTDLIKMYNLEKNIILKGNTSDLSQAYLNSSIYVLPSRFEGFGLVLIEAAAFGLPIISFDCPNGPKEILKDNLGILVPNGNIDQLTKAILMLIENKALRIQYGQRGKLIYNKYTEEQIYPLWKDLFNTISLK